MSLQVEFAKFQMEVNLALNSMRQHIDRLKGEQGTLSKLTKQIDDVNEQVVKTLPTMAKAFQKVADSRGGLRHRIEIEGSTNHLGRC